MVAYLAAAAAQATAPAGAGAVVGTTALGQHEGVGICIGTDAIAGGNEVSGQYGEGSGEGARGCHGGRV